jgi:hypothetical protein
MRSSNNGISCLRCDTFNFAERKKCTRCGLDLWCEWSPKLYEHPITLTSLGRSKHARLFGNWLVVATVGGLLAFTLLADLEPLLTTRTVVPVVVIALGTYNVWAFTHGRAVTLGEAGTEEALIAKTSSRIVTVSISAFFIALGWLLLTW